MIKRNLWGLTLFLLVYSCSNEQAASKHDGVAGTDSISGKVADPAGSNDIDPIPAWANKLAEEYVNTSNSLLVKAAREGHIIDTWLFDGVVPTDTAQYIILHIGHDVTEPDGSEPRFVTDQWLYVDTVSRKVYEYDEPSGGVLPWRK